MTAGTMSGSPSRRSRKFSFRSPPWSHRIGDCHPRVASTKKPPHHSAANDFDVSELFPIKNALSGRRPSESQRKPSWPNHILVIMPTGYLMTRLATVSAKVPGCEANTIVNNDARAVTAPPAGC